MNDYRLAEPPEFLYRAVEVGQVDEIFINGFNVNNTPRIELFETEHSARYAIPRKAHPYIITILAEHMSQDGYSFFRTATGWHTDVVPPKYVRLHG